MEYAVVRIWKDNPKDFEVVEYVPTVKIGMQYIKSQEKSDLYKWDIMRYENTY